MATDVFQTPILQFYTPPLPWCLFTADTNIVAGKMKFISSRNYLFVVHITMLPAGQISVESRMTMNTELKGTWKEAVVVWFKGSVSVFACKGRANENSWVGAAGKPRTQPSKYRFKSLLLEPARPVSYDQIFNLTCFCLKLPLSNGLNLCYSSPCIWSI
jgi:hypothetical protein